MATSGWQLPSKPSALADRDDLLCSSDVPVHQKMPFILCGYRPIPGGLMGLLRTVFTLHNETGNMWTHLLGSAYFAAVGVRFCLDALSAEEQERLEGEAWVFALVVASAFCLMCSFGYHLCNCTGSGVCHCMHKVDQIGIVVLISASYFTGIALGFRCRPVLRCIYLAYAGGVALALLGPLLRPHLVQDMTRHFIVCVALGVIPAAHFMCISSREGVARVAPYLAAMFGCYGIGALFFVSRWPERRWPGRFDLLGHSHQFWHIFVLLAAVSWVRGSFAMLDHYGKLVCEV